MRIRILSKQELALLDTSRLQRPSEQINAWFRCEKRWAIALCSETQPCSGLLLAVEESGHVRCTALVVAVDEPEDTLTYRLIHALCDLIPGLEPKTLQARLPQANKAVVEALQVMGVLTEVTRSTPITSGPGHFAA